MPAYEKMAVALGPRVRWCAALIAGLFLVLLARLWYLQVIQGDYFRFQSENNRIRQVYVPPPRGLIQDRNGVVIAKNRPAFQVDVVLEDTPDLEAALGRLAELTGREGEELLKAAKSPGRRRPFEPRMLLKDISRELVAQIEARRWELPGIQVGVIPARYYPYGDLAAHVVGYVGEISARQLESPGYTGYRMGDVVGQTGIEARWERYLQGQRGVKEVVVNATGTKTGEASFERELSGHNVVLTIDADVQAAAERALGDRRGAVVAMDTRSGEVWALVSNPRYDPNWFAGDMPKGMWAELVQGSGRPLTNRATQGTYPPGSVFKVVMEAAALDSGVMSLAERVTCLGQMKIGNRFFRCHKREGHGSVNHFGALVESCDVYFYTVGNRLGVDRIHEYALRFGMGQPTGLGLGEESAGLVPSTEWKRRAFRDPEQQRWYPGETPSVAIGQGAVTATPIQMARVVAAVANGGKLHRPSLIRKIESSDGSFLDDSFAPEVVGELGIDATILQVIRDDLEGVVNDARGTARRAKMPEEWGIKVAGKTGTSQVVALDKHKKGTELDHHAWFVGYAPSDSPELVVSVIVENGGSGGFAAAPVVQETLKAYFMKTRGLKDPAAPATTSTEGASDAD